MEEEGIGTAIFPYNGLEYSDEDNSENDISRLENNHLKLSLSERPLFYGAEDWEVATIGGYAHWINDCSLYACPRCGKTMKYLAQLPWETVSEGYMEGSLYIQVCTDCKMVGLEHQQS